MNIADIIVPERVICDVDVNSKKRALEKLGDVIADNANGNGNIPVQDVVDSLLARERLGSTGIGYGVAIPHGRLKNTNKAIAAFIRLSHGIDFDAIDNQQVDLLFALLVPENSTEEHLQLLAQLAEMFSNNEFRDKLRTAKEQAAIYSLLSTWEHSQNQEAS